MWPFVSIVKSALVKVNNSISSEKIDRSILPLMLCLHTFTLEVNLTHPHYLYIRYFYCYIGLNIFPGNHITKCPLIPGRWTISCLQHLLFLLNRERTSVTQSSTETGELWVVVCHNGNKLVTTEDDYRWGAQEDSLQNVVREIDCEHSLQEPDKTVETESL